MPVPHYPSGFVEGHRPALLIDLFADAGCLFCSMFVHPDAPRSKQLSDISRLID